MACSGSNCLPTGSWWPVIAPNLNVAARKFQNVSKYRCATCMEQSLPILFEQSAPSGTKWRKHIDLWRKQSANWNPLECNGMEWNSLPEVGVLLLQVGFKPDQQVIKHLLGHPGVVHELSPVILSQVFHQSVVLSTFGPQLWVEHRSKPPVVIPFLLRRLSFFRIGHIS